MGKNVNWFSAIFGALFGAVVAAGSIATAAPGDLIYEARGEPVEISAAQAATAADWAIGVGAWDGDRADLIRLTVIRSDQSSTGFWVQAHGLKTAAPASLPEKPVRVVGKVE